jgi:hypothetical protein
MKRKDAITMGQSRTCPNPMCGKVFTSPLKTENLGSKNTEAYYACPYCLTEITIEQDLSDVGEKKELEVKEIRSKKPAVHPMEKEPTQPLPTVQGCAHDFGYLSKRSSKEKIPEECMTCERIVQCMLKNVTG